MNVTTLLLLGILLGVCVLLYEISTGIRAVIRRLDRLAEHLDSKSK